MNQCMGCQAGWKREIRQRMGHTLGQNLVYYFHRVVGGYPGETVVCTKDKY